MPLNRRELLALIASGTFLLSARGLAAPDPDTLAAPALALDFPQGVASADPTPEAVMLWTRAVPANGAARVRVLLQVSTTADFAEPLLEAPLSVTAERDYTLRAHVEGLAPDTRYYYRFLGAGGTASRVGRTRTAPAPEQARDVRVAFVSCQNYEQAFFGAWARMLADDEAAAAAEQIDFVLHLGDFIYERCWHTREDGSAPSRVVPPFPDGVHNDDNRYATSLADYRHLYRTYLSDPWLQAARARWPFISTWDDHEFSDDCFQSYSNYYDRAKLEARRKVAANRAWFEYVPSALDDLGGQPAHDLRPAHLAGDAQRDNRSARDTLCIYRRLHWGRHLDLLLTDSRSYRTPPCLEPGLAESVGLPMNTVKLVAIADAGRTYNDGQPPAYLPYGDGTTPNPARDRAPGSCLGHTQRDWLLKQARASTATWKLWGNAIPLLPLRLDLSNVPFSGYEDTVFNIDAWHGYPSEANHILGELQTAGVTGLVSLSGDHHMHGAGEVRPDPNAPGTSPVAVDFSCAGISSSPLYDNVRAIASEDHPDFAALVEAEHGGQPVPNWNLTLQWGVLAAYSFRHLGSARLARWLGPNTANPGLAFVDATANGYGIAHFGASHLRVALVSVARVREAFEQAPPIEYTAHFTLPLWAADEGPRLEGPDFQGRAPFPFSLATG